MGNLFNGWLGYGTNVTSGVLAEPTDPAYARRPYVLRSPDAGITSDIGSGTVGPASQAWGTIGYYGIFDAQSGGNLLFWLPRTVPVQINAGMTIAAGPAMHVLWFPDLQASLTRTVTWPAGAGVAQLPDGRVAIAGVSLQFCNGMLAAQTSTFGTMVTMATLPVTQPVTGSGQLWNNGGVISVA